MTMSRMNRSERAAYLIGLAVLRQLEHAPRDPDTLREIEAVSRWIDHWLTGDEYVHVTTTTGYDFGGYFSEDLPPWVSVPAHKDDGGGPVRTKDGSWPGVKRRPSDAPNNG
jgi:hypothetical protein